MSIIVTTKKNTSLVKVTGGAVNIVKVGNPPISNPPTGKYRVINLYVNPATQKLVVEYDDGS